MAVYPRWRGEHSLPHWINPASRGLSPLARGTHVISGGFHALTRFIPAGAGNTSPAACPSWVGTVYPRWRGEHRRKERGYRIKLGLSPLARGTRSPWLFALNTARFIPAGAGNTTAAANLRWTITVYPRWRGEHEIEAEPGEFQIGLSPLARGTPKSPFCY